MRNYQLTCGHCRKFDQKLNAFRCIPGHNGFASVDTPACGYFHRVADVRLHTEPAKFQCRAGDRREV